MNYKKNEELCKESEVFIIFSYFRLYKKFRLFLINELKDRKMWGKKRKKREKNCTG